MKIHYCLPIIKKTKEEVLETIKMNRQEYDYFEIWLDYVRDVDESFVKHLIADLQEKLLLLFRRQNLEEIHMQENTRKHILSLLQNTPALIDLDITTQREELEYIKENNLQVQLITSYHNYTETPDNETFEKIISDMAYYAPAIYKVATFCQTENDTMQLLQLLLTLRKQDKQYIVLGMGEKGLATRIFGTVWGNAMIFAPRKKDENSAPGQLTKTQLEDIFSIIRN